jgi:hypothetical protein
METTEIVMDKPKKKRGGRVPGSKNKRTLIGKDVSETLKNWLGFDNASVERTGQIDGEGYRGRLALREMWEDRRPIDPRYIALAKFLFSYAYGTPGKFQPDVVQRDPLVFATLHGYQPWDDRAPGAAAINARSKEMNAAKDQMLALEAKGEVIEVEKKGDTEIDAETLESVNLPEDPGAHGRGR